MQYIHQIMSTEQRTERNRTLQATERPLTEDEINRIPLYLDRLRKLLTSQSYTPPQSNKHKDYHDANFKLNEYQIYIEEEYSGENNQFFAIDLERKQEKHPPTGNNRFGIEITILPIAGPSVDYYGPDTYLKPPGRQHAVNNATALAGLEKITHILEMLRK